jgi:hypothetical protein
MNPQLALEALITWLSDISFLPIAVPAVVFLTAFAKRLPFLSGISSAVIALVVQVVIWIAWVVSKKLGVDDALFTSWIDAFTTILSGLSAIVIGTGATSQLYARLNDNNVPVVGQSRHPNG